jgi:hypothetical protein
MPGCLAMFDRRRGFASVLPHRGRRVEFDTVRPTDGLMRRNRLSVKCYTKSARERDPVRQERTQTLLRSPVRERSTQIPSLRSLEKCHEVLMLTVILTKRFGELLSAFAYDAWP